MAAPVAGPALPSSSKVPDESAQAMAAFIQGAYDEEGADGVGGTSLVDVKLPDVIAQPWAQGHVRLVEAVRSLGPALTTEDEVQRSRAVVLLSLLVTTLIGDPSSLAVFDKQATTTLATFFASKIDDGNIVAGNIAQARNASTALVPGSAPEFRRRKFPPGTEMLVAALRALSALSKLDAFASEAAKVTADK